MKHFLLVISVILFYSCSKTTELTYFGGEVVNPKDHYVYLKFQDEIIDSAALDKDNRFLFELTDLAEGVYRFSHGIEFQYILLEKADSLMARLNTLEFDESIIFSGVGAEKNNFLIDMFLLEEDEGYLKRKFYQASPEAFIRKIDSMRDMKLEEYKELIQEADLSPLAQHITKAAIDIPYYTTREHYAAEHKFWMGLEEHPKLPEGFYSHHQDIDLNDESLAYYGVYLKYIDRHLDHLTRETCRKVCSTSGKMNAYHYSTHKLNLIDSLITLDKLRGFLLENTAITYFTYDHDKENNSRFMQQYLEATGGDTSPDLDRFYKAVTSLRKGEDFPALELFDSNGQKHLLDASWFDQKTVFYLWSSDQKMHAKKTLKHIEALKTKYPSYKFIGINLDTDHEQWKTTLQQMNVEDATQLRAPDMKYMTKHLAYLRFNRMLVVDQNGKVIEGFGNIYNLSPLEFSGGTSKVAKARGGI
ncbi:TlpA family protein disulfide reductase [Robertkochia sediminum]|uniref:TlpA family protein disulfide reductase n=1 Tax=Robertkochia sediminum TaxID=2785326 RepID=UPI001931D328|nr:thioredoxin-like domain-containing protein [Robertkochia sediminum]MBL7473597.1 hypothetical protein [Robertkochia sediminum]